MDSQFGHKTYIFPPLEPHTIPDSGEILDCRSIPDLSIDTFLKKLPAGKTVIIKHLEYFLPLVDVLLLNLQILAENEGRKFIFTTTFNPYSERLYDRLKNLPLILDEIKYITLTRTDFNLRETEIFWYNLMQIQQRLLRLILAGQSKFEPNFLPDVDYLRKTGIVTGSRVNLPLLNRFLAQNQDQKLHIAGGKIFLGEESLEDHLNPRQTAVLKLLLSHFPELVAKEKIAAAVWGGNDDYSDWAMDKFIQRLRQKLEQRQFPGKNIVCLKRRGIYLANSAGIPQPKTTTRTPNLVFEAMVNHRETLNFYIKSFQDPALRKILYATTPYTSQEISNWLTELITNPDITPFTIRLKGKIIGQVDLDDPNPQSRSVRLGCFLAQPNLWPKYGPEIFKFIIAEAQKRNWKLIYCDVAGAESAQITALEGLGFKKNINKPSLLTFQPPEDQQPF